MNQKINKLFKYKKMEDHYAYTPIEDESELDEEIDQDGHANDL